jgi:hypothetical protein
MVGNPQSEWMPMSIVFYPEHEHGRRQVSHCPHLGGAALGTLVHRANENEEFRRYLLGTIDAEREPNSRLVEENERLKLESRRDDIGDRQLVIERLQN